MELIILGILFFLFILNTLNSGLSIFLKRKLIQNPNEIFSLTGSELKEVLGVLTESNRNSSISYEDNNFLMITYIAQNQELKKSLLSIGVSADSLNRAIKFYSNKIAVKADIFLENIGVDKVVEVKKELYKVHIGDNSFLLYITNDRTEEIQQKLICTEENIIVLAHEVNQDIIAKWALDKSNRIVAPTQEELKRIVFRETEIKLLREVFMKCLSYKNLSPYQENQNISYLSNSFGEQSIIENIMINDNQNYFIVGAKGSGKSTLLRELEKQYFNKYIIDCYYVDLKNKSNILELMSEELGINNDVNTLTNELHRKNSRQVFLIDNTELFFKEEKNSNFKVLDILKNISTRRIIFVFTASWFFYNNYILQKEKKIADFGKVKYLKSLEYKACRKLIVKPMKELGIEYQYEVFIDNIITLCGYRFDLIRVFCDEILQDLEGNTIGEVEIGKASKSQRINTFLLNLLKCEDTEFSKKLDKIIIDITRHKKLFTTLKIMDALKNYDLEVTTQEVTESLEKLVFLGVFEKKGKQYSYKILLFKYQEEEHGWVTK